jgi:hypothetical protein
MGGCASKSARLDKKAAKLASVDASITSGKERLRALQAAIDGLPELYSSWAASKGLLQLPSLATWALDGKAPSLGSAEVMGTLHHHAAWLFELGVVQSSVWKKEAQTCISHLKAAQQSLAEGIGACNSYLESELKCEEKRRELGAKVKVRTACERHLDKQAAELRHVRESQAAQSADAPAPAAERLREMVKGAEGRHTLAQESVAEAQEACGQADATYQRALAAADVAKTHATRELDRSLSTVEEATTLAFTALRTGYERCHAFAAAVLSRPADFQVSCRPAPRAAAPRPCAAA